MKRVRIVSDGTPLGTRLKDADTGEDLGIGFMSVRWEASSNDLARCIVEIDYVEVDVVGEISE